MSEHQKDYDIVRAKLEKSGKLERIRDELRDMVERCLDEKYVVKEDSKMKHTHEQYLLFELMKEALSSFGFDRTIKTLAEEADISNEVLDREFLLSQLGLHRKVDSSEIPILLFLTMNIKR
ncbi:lisH domain-containing protein FOPNL [Aduncisulcus paluster]|uniref:LisH domain-containing protein FOPNL n=1 Tax=Aduncisulcus paluster TaxID=2918883 RepID=A0ABQ5KYB3_9EUKA|nr:lisH domain-containing protein FOPNL [Aduncisulcus paluster]